MVGRGSTSTLWKPVVLAVTQWYVNKLCLRGVLLCVLFLCIGWLNLEFDGCNVQSTSITRRRVLRIVKLLAWMGLLRRRSPDPTMIQVHSMVKLRYGLLLMWRPVSLFSVVFCLFSCEAVCYFVEVFKDSGSNCFIFSCKQAEKESQDDMLDDLSTVLSQMKELSMDMNTEIERYLLASNFVWRFRAFQGFMLVCMIEVSQF